LHADPTNTQLTANRDWAVFVFQDVVSLLRLSTGEARRLVLPGALHRQAEIGRAHV